MFHALYILAFAALTVLAVSNLIRNMMLLGRSTQGTRRGEMGGDRPQSTASHPEMLDEAGRVTQEPLLVMRSISLQDARQQLEALYDPSNCEQDDLADDAD